MLAPQETIAHRALLIEPQTLFAPYFVATLESLGLRVVGVTRRVNRTILEAKRPDLVVIDADHLSKPPLRVIRDVRRLLPNARIIVYAHATDALWTAIATSLGADIVVGPKATESDFIAAVVQPLAV